MRRSAIRTSTIRTSMMVVMVGSALSVAGCASTGVQGTAAADAAVAGKGPVGPAIPFIQQLSGYWVIIKSGRGDPPNGTEAPLAPAQKKVNAELVYKWHHGQYVDDRTDHCITPGFPLMYSLSLRMEVNANYILQIGGDGPAVRIIMLNKKAHTPASQLVPSYGGDAIAHMEGNTLVIDTIGLDSGNELVHGLAFNDDNIHYTERLTMPNPDEIHIALHVEAPKALTRPWDYEVWYKRASFDYGMIYCADPVSNDALNLTPPEGGYVPPGAK